MLHSRQRPRRPQRSASLTASEDPYSPSSPDYAARHRVFVSDVPDVPGLVRVDVGAPAPQSN